jgi:hypothetical protein
LSLNLNSTSSFSDCCNTKTQKDPTELTNQIQGWTGIPGPDETPVLQELSDHEPGAQGPVIGDMREKEQLETLTLEDKPALTSNAKPIPKGPTTVPIGIPNAEPALLGHPDAGAEI